MWNVHKKSNSIATSECLVGLFLSSFCRCGLILENFEIDGLTEHSISSCAKKENTKPSFEWIIGRDKFLSGVNQLMFLFFQKVLLHLSFPQTHELFTFLNLKIWIFGTFKAVIASQPWSSCPSVTKIQIYKLRKIKRSYVWGNDSALWKKAPLKSMYFRKFISIQWNG